LLLRGSPLQLHQAPGHNYVHGIQPEQLAILRPEMTPIGGPNNVAKNAPFLVAEMWRRRKIGLESRDYG
jgi:hypothetical protein